MADGEVLEVIPMTNLEAVDILEAMLRDGNFPPVTQQALRIAAKELKVLICKDNMMKEVEADGQDNLKSTVHGEGDRKDNEGEQGDVSSEDPVEAS